LYTEITNIYEINCTVADYKVIHAQLNITNNIT